MNRGITDKNHRGVAVATRHTEKYVHEKRRNTRVYTDVPTEVAGKDEAAGPPRTRTHQVKIARTLTRMYAAKGGIVHSAYNDTTHSRMSIIRKMFLSLTFDHSFRRGELLRVVRGHAVYEDGCRVGAGLSLSFTPLGSLLYFTLPLPRSHRIVFLSLSPTLSLSLSLSLSRSHRVTLSLYFFSSFSSRGYSREVAPSSHERGVGWKERAVFSPREPGAAHTHIHARSRGGRSRGKPER